MLGTVSRGGGWILLAKATCPKYVSTKHGSYRSVFNRMMCTPGLVSIRDEIDSRTKSILKVLLPPWRHSTNFTLLGMPYFSCPRFRRSGVSICFSS